MRYVDGLTSEEWFRRRETWHKWFAWRPVVYGVQDEHKLKVWLEWIERKGMYHSSWDSGWWEWEYRFEQPQGQEGQG